MWRTAYLGATQVNDTVDDDRIMQRCQIFYENSARRYPDAGEPPGMADEPLGPLLSRAAR